MITLAYSQTYGNQLVAEHKIKKGTAFYKIKNYRILVHPTYQSIQISANEHIWEKTIIYLNHSCNPNTIFNVEKMQLCAIRDIEKSEEITFFYPSTEWDLHRPFHCLCNSKQCLKVIKGAKYLSDELVSQYFINLHINLQKGKIDIQLSSNFDGVLTK